MCPFAVLVQHPSGDGDEGDPRWISGWTADWSSIFLPRACQPLTKPVCCRYGYGQRYRSYGGEWHGDSYNGVYGNGYGGGGRYGNGGGYGGGYVGGYGGGYGYGDWQKQPRCFKTQRSKRLNNHFPRRPIDRLNY